MPMIWKRLTNITNAVTLHPVSYVVQNTVSLHTSKVAYQASACLRYLYHEATRSVFTSTPLPPPPPRWGAGHCRVTPQHEVRRYPFIHLGRERHGKGVFPRTQHNVLS